MRAKLVAVAVAALAPVIAMLAYNEVAMRLQRSQEVRMQAAQAARQASFEVERIVEGLRWLMVAVTAMPSVRHQDANTCNEALTSLAANVPNIQTLFVLSPAGTPICGSAAIPRTTNFADRDYFKKALQTKAFVVGRYTKSRVSDSPVLPLAMPVVEGDRVRAVVVSGIRLDWLQNRVTERGIAPGSAVTIADDTGTILARVPLAERFVGTVIPPDFQKLIHADEPGVINVMSQDGTERVLGYRPISEAGLPLYVSAGFSTAEAFGPIDRATVNNVIGIVLGVATAFCLSMFIGKRFILTPISHIADVMERWRGGEAAARTRMNGTDELAAVGASLDRLLDELDCRRTQNESVEEERMLLVRELTHRVKNGFALVQAIARQTFARSDPDRYRSFSERLAALGGTYDLILSREGLASPIRAILTAALRAHVASEAQNVSLDGPDFVLPPDLALPLSLVVHELATNATKYGSLGTECGTVEVLWKRDGKRLVLTWTESGGPTVINTGKKGFGSVLIERAFPAKFEPKCLADYRPEGLVFELSFTAVEMKAEIDAIASKVEIA
ncbi:sensor histidine kinase [Rhizobium grahamii]|uniref:histidine kinase n=1 Tax=Rhizobium grahamii CCGE 502 TaxID=990285 RepID=S3HDT7_9HYPH|nr:HWE histidine kinase domain-containing protein [Rhizobium grahamii]EPE96220.1 putative two-component sensor histidine kinase [Rhizobium grahamii CCGE 502]